MFKTIQWQIIGLILSAIPATIFAQGQNPENDAPSGPDSEQIYNALDVREWKLTFINPETGMPRIGITTFEKSTGGLLCRRTAPVVLNPVFRYECYIQLTLTNEHAMTLFELLDTRTEKVAYLDPETGAPRVGVNIFEKSKGGLLCQSIEPVILNPVPRYTCYTDIAGDTLRSEKRHLNDKWKKHWSDD